MATNSVGERGTSSEATGGKIPTEEIKMAIEVWKTVIEVQQHFNTIEMQIRNIAITVLTATIGAAVLASNQSLNAVATATAAGKTLPPVYPLVLLGKSFSSASLIIGAGLIAWGAFYFMDRWWYHRYLQGAVRDARAIEEKLQGSFSYMALSTSIKKASPFKIFGKEIHSQNRIDLFYLTVAALLLVLIFLVF